MNRSDFILQLIVIEKAFLGVLGLVFSAGVLSLINQDLEAFATELARYLNLEANNRFLILLMENIPRVRSSTLIGASMVGVAYSGLNFIEAYGLHKRYRWAEYLTVISTGIFIPFELYEVIRNPTLIPFSILVINVSIVYFLAKHKELFPKHLWGPDSP